MPRPRSRVPALAWASVLALSTTLESAALASPESDFADAQRAFDAGRFERALELFRSVLLKVKSPNAAFMAARSLQKLDRLPEAFEAMDDAVSLASAKLGTDPSYRATRDAAAAEREALAASIGRLVVVVAEPPDELSVDLDARSLDSSHFGRPLGVAPGPHRLSARAPGRTSLTRELNLAAGSLETTVVTLGRTDPPSETGTGRASPLRTVGFVGVGLGVVSLGTAAATWLIAEKKYDELGSLCGTTPCQASGVETLIDEGKRLDTVTNVALGVGLASLVTGAALTAIGWPSESSTTALELRLSPSEATLRVSF